MYQRHNHATSNPPSAPRAPQNHSLTVDLAPLRRNSRVCKPPDMHGFISPLSLTAMLSSIAIPSSYKQAMEHDHWHKAIETKLLALEENQTWNVVPYPPSINPLSSKFVLSIKLRSDGFIDSYKTRLVVLGNKQEYGLNYGETFAPVAKMTTVRIVLALAASQSWLLYQLDVKNAFLYGDLEEEVYIKLPKGMTTPSLNAVCKLKHS